MFLVNSIRDAYHVLKETNADYLLAFGQGSYFTFVLGDADKIVEALPDTPKYSNVKYSAVRIHSTQFFQFAARLKAVGLKVAMVARKKLGPKVKYSITMRSDEE